LKTGLFLVCGILLDTRRSELASAMRRWQVSELALACDGSRDSGHISKNAETKDAPALWFDTSTNKAGLGLRSQARFV